ncbi:MAG: anti-sigma factor [Acidobacteria bacterium]|nr:anti-sigma factor [Acidobacteriota bacterium]
MRCDDIREALPLRLLDLLEPDEERVIREHLESGCTRCAADLAAYSETLALLPHDLPREEPSEIVKARLMARIRRESAQEGKAPVRPPVAASPPAGTAARQRRLVWTSAAAASVVAALLASFVTARIVSGRHAAETASLAARVEEQQGRLERQTEEMASLKAQVLRARESIQLVSSPGVTVIDLQGQPDRPKAGARVFWDRAGGYWQVYVASLPPAGPGKTYQLWFVTAGAKISAGTFDTDSSGTATVRFEVPAGLGNLVATAITDEPAGGSPQPTGSMVLLGKV